MQTEADAAWFCSRKKRYSTRRHASAVASEARASGSPRLVVYACPVCDGWHLAKRSER